MHRNKQTSNGATTKSMKRKVNMLPEDLIVEIVAQLVSHSSQPFADLYNLKNT